MSDTKNAVPIDCFIGKYRWLSNFHPKQIFWRGFWFNSNENAYQFTKGIGANEPDVLTRFHSPLIVPETGKVLPVYTASEAKQAGRKIKMREDWDRLSYAVMLLLTIEKYSTEPERQMLRETGTAPIIEGNWWHDNRWGKCMYASRADALAHMAGKSFIPCYKCINVNAQDMLGQIIMRVRSDIAFDETPKQ